MGYKDVDGARQQTIVICSKEHQRPTGTNTKLIAGLLCKSEGTQGDDGKQGKRAEPLWKRLVDEAKLSL